MSKKLMFNLVVLLVTVFCIIFYSVGCQSRGAYVLKVDCNMVTLPVNITTKASDTPSDNPLLCVSVKQSQEDPYAQFLNSAMVTNQENHCEWDLFYARMRSYFCGQRWIRDDEYDTVIELEIHRYFSELLILTRYMEDEGYNLYINVGAYEDPAEAYLHAIEEGRTFYLDNLVSQP